MEHPYKGHAPCPLHDKEVVLSIFGGIVKIFFNLGPLNLFIFFIVSFIIMVPNQCKL